MARRRRLLWPSSTRATPRPVPAFAFALLAFAALEISAVPPTTALWATPAILFSAMVIAWGAESAQFFVAQGFALAILAWMQTLPEFAVEAVLAWKQQVPLLLANLTGALRLLTGLGWPCIYAAAALVHRKRHQRGLAKITLDQEHAVEVIGLLLPLIYMFWVWFKSSLGIADAVVLIIIYVAYLWLLSHLPPEDQESIDDLPAVPRAVVLAPPMLRNLGIFGLFALGGALIYFSAEPFLGSLLAVSTMIGVPTFVFVQWIAPFVSEFPEMATAINWARSVHKAPMALMNMVSSNINQWTLLPAMLAVVYSISRGTATSIPFDDMQELELLMTLGQALVAMSFLVSMSLAWWEALALFLFWFVQMALSPMQGAQGFWGYLAHHVNWVVTAAYFAWAGAALLGYIFRPARAVAFHQFGRVWREHVRKA